MCDLKFLDDVKLKNYLRMVQLEQDVFEDLFPLVGLVIIYYLFNFCLFMIFQRQ